MSSNGGWVRFIVRYQVRSPEFWWKYGLRLGVRRVLLQDLRRDASSRDVELAGLDLVVDVVGVRVDR